MCWLRSATVETDVLVASRRNCDSTLSKLALTRPKPSPGGGVAGPCTVLMDATEMLHQFYGSYIPLPLFWDTRLCSVLFVSSKNVSP
jgi:hypothetical protein